MVTTDMTTRPPIDPIRTVATRLVGTEIPHRTTIARTVIATRPHAETIDDMDVPTRIIPPLPDHLAQTPRKVTDSRGIETVALHRRLHPRVHLVLCLHTDGDDLGQEFQTLPLKWQAQPA